MALTPYPALATLPEVAQASGKIPSGFLNPSYVSLRHDLGIPSDATIEGVGASTFSDAGYGTLTLPALVTPIGSRPSETVTQRIQAALNLAASGPVGIYWDARCSVGVSGTAGSALISALLMRRPGNLHIIGRPGCGAILRAQCNSAILANEMPTFGPAVSGGGTNTQISSIGNINFGNITVEGLYLNGNSGVITGTTSSPNQLSPTFTQTFYLNVLRMYGVQDVTFRDCTIVGCGGFHTYWGNWQRVRFFNCVIDSQGAGGTVGGNDCFHLNGPGNDFLARDCQLASEDDHFGLNTGDGNNQGGLANVPAWGSVTNVRGINTTVLRAATNGNFVRWMAGAGMVNTGHEFDGVYGVINGLGLVVTSGGTSPGPLGTLDFRNLNIDFSGHGVSGDGSNPSSIARIGFRGVRRSAHLSIPLIDVTNPPQRLVLDDYDVQGTGSSGNFANIHSGVTVPLTTISRAFSTSGSLISNSGTLSNLIVSNTDPGTTIVSGTAASAHGGDYYGSGGGGGGLSTLFDETFTGTAASDITGAGGSPTAHSTDVWATFSPYPAFVYKTGGGCTTATFSSSVALSYYPMTGFSGDGTWTWKFSKATAANLIHIRFYRDVSGFNELAIALDFGGGTVSLGQTISNSSAALGSSPYSYSLSAAVDYTLVSTISGTSWTLTLNDGTTTTTVASGVTITTPTGSGMAILQIGGSAGDVVFTEIKVEA